MWPFDYKHRALARFEAEKASWEKYEKSLIELNSRTVRRITQQAEDFTQQVSQIKIDLQAAFQVVQTDIQKGFDDRLIEILNAHQERVSQLQKDLTQLQNEHKNDLEIRDAELSIKQAEMARKQATLDVTIQKYEDAYSGVVELSGVLKELTGAVGQKAFNDKMEASQTQATVKDIGDTVDQIRKVLLPKVVKSLGMSTEGRI